MFAAAFLVVQNRDSPAFVVFEGSTKVDKAAVFTNLLGINLAFCRMNGKKTAIENTINVKLHNLQILNWRTWACFQPHLSLLLKDKVNTSVPDFCIPAAGLTHSSYVYYKLWIT